MALLHYYKNGILVSGGGGTPGRSQGRKPLEEGEDQPGQSDKSRRRAAFNLGNADCEWFGMITLTYDSASLENITGKKCKKHLRSYRETLRRLGVSFGWILEFTRSGNPHFHIFLPSPCPLDLEWRKVRRNGKEVEVATMHGDGGKLVDSWQRIAGKKDRSFDEGGIIEKFRLPDAAGRYVAKESAKRVQKNTPEGFGWVGNWWGMSANLRPKRLYSVEIPESSLPAYKYIWDKNTLNTVPTRLESYGDRKMTITKPNHPSRCESSGTCSRPDSGNDGGDLFLLP